MNAGYHSYSVEQNLGTTLLALCIFLKFFYVWGGMLLYLAKKNTRCKLRLPHPVITLLENLSTPAYFQFEMSASIITLTSALIYLRFTPSYESEVVVSATRLWTMDWFLSVTQLSVPFYFVLHLTYTASVKGWWGL